MADGVPLARVHSKALNRDRIVALAKLILMPIRGHRFTAPAGEVNVGEQLNALALVVADVVASAGADGPACRAWFDTTLTKIIAAERAPAGTA